ncbi:MAG: hypothetical protein RBQ97_03425 [Acholeplasma sp.]|nr:hypothetical protein [Acholeplasma sp.]
MKRLKGMTYSHEHVRVDLSRIKNIDDTNLNCKEETIEEFKRLKELGVDNVVEVTNMGMGRDIQYMEDVRKASGVNLLYSTGFYKEPFLPDFFYEKTTEELADLMVHELTVGIDGTNIKASVIGEVGTSKNEMTEAEHKLYEASVMAHKRTNAPISTHTTLGTYILEQAKFFIERGVSPDRVYIGHCDIGGDIEAIKSVLKQGFFIGFDTVHKNNYYKDEDRIKMLLELQKENLMDGVMMALDITRKTQLKYKGGYGYESLITNFVPAMLEAGITIENIEKIFVHNPKRYLKGLI